MNKPPKKQHYLPCVYLKQFSTDGMNANRKSNIWRLGEKVHRVVSVESQCVEDYFYSENDPQSAEEIFQPIEGLYGKIAKIIWNCGNAKTRQEYYGLIIAMFEFHLRNAMYQNSSGRESLEAFRMRFGSFRDAHFIPELNRSLTDKEFVEHIQRFWRVRLLIAADHDFLVTSDNPSLWFFSIKNHKHFFFTLPITPITCAVAYDIRHFKIASTYITKKDLKTLNLHQIYHCLSAIFSHRKLELNDVHEIRNRWTMRNKPAGDTGTQSWTASYLQWKGNDHLSFIEPVESDAKI